jgi:hypothetical protein
MISRWMVSVAALMCAAFAGAAENSPNGTSDAKASAAPLRYTFSWPLDGTNVKPRGGTSKGAPIVLDRDPSAEWQALQAASQSSQERDRRAILAMAGTYRVTFDFLEITPFVTQDKPNAPYQSWGTEKVYVDRDTGKSISLVHILEMRVVQSDGSISQPMVTKHWRQDWTYEPTHIVEYRGRDRWERRKLAPADSKGVWLQAVYQVDESPRYASVGRWQHSASFSTWASGETWRPLPRREWSVRDDYQVLIGTNRHTVTSTGWLQEENNLKSVLDGQRKMDAARPYVGREYGVARYERIRDADFAAANQYYERTKQFWDQVSNTWADLFAKQGEVTLRGPVDKLGLFQPLFARAGEIEDGTGPAGVDDSKVIREALQAMGAIK